jgi:hypothetical protein
MLVEVVAGLDQNRRVEFEDSVETHGAGSAGCSRPRMGISNLTGTFRMALRAFDCSILATANSPEAFEIIERYIFPSFPRTEAANDAPDVSLHIEQAEDEFRLSKDGELFLSSGQAIDLVPHLIHLLDEAVVQRLVSLRAVHAGTVLLNGRALLLPGATHSGKSSIVAELLRRGATYFSDEYALIDADGLVHPYPRPLLLRKGSPEQFPVVAGECNAPVGKARAPVGWILLLQYEAGCAWNITPVPQSLALVALLQNTPHALADSPELIDMFQRAVAGATCHAGRRAEATDAATEIMRLTGFFTG